jgi:hypothetical protein
MSLMESVREESSTAVDRHPFVSARAWPNEEIWEAFEAWEPKHVADLVQGPGVVKGAYYHAVTTGLPEVYLGSGNIMAYYTGRDLDGLFAFLNSQQFADAVAEGSQWFGKFNSVDFEEITGNIYTVDAVVKRDPEQRTPDDVPYVLWQRFEAPDDASDEFAGWADAHVRAIGAQPGVVRARTLTAVREGCPLPYYYSRGNRMVAAELETLDTLRTPAFLDAIADSLRWDLRLSYVKRDVYAYRYHHDSAHGGEH